MTAEAEFAAGMTERAKGDERKALEYLKRATALDPKMTKAYFAIGSIASGWCGVDEGDPLCEVAISGYQQVVELEPLREDAWKRLAYASYRIYRIEQAERYYRRALSLDANDPEMLGGLAAFDMVAARLDVYSTRVEHNIATESELIDSPFCAEARGRSLARVTEGIEFAARARETKSKNLDLMGILSALYATRAQIQCSNPKSFKDDVDVSKRWDRRRRKIRQAMDRNLENMPPGAPPSSPTRRRWDPRPPFK